MREGWKEVELGDIAPYWTEKIDASELNENNYISADNMEVDRGGISKSVYTPNEGRVTLFENNDILVSNIRPYFKKIWQAKYRGGCSNDVFVLRANNNITDARFLYFYLSKEDFFDFMMAGANGTKMPRGNKKSIPNYKILLPPLPTQRKIATILSAYDDLIENNLKRINLLEEKAELTYEEWFVRMKFPGHETVKVDEGTGLPEGWERKKIGEVIEVGRGSSPRPIADQKYFVDGDIPWLKIADATASNIFIYETKQYVNDYGASFSRKLPIGSIVVAASGTLGFPMILGVEACIHDGWLYFKGIDDKLMEYFYFSFIGLRSYFESISYGAAIQNINTGIVRQSPFIIPIEEISIKFKKFASNIFENISNLQNQNRLLKEARDILLPRLMSGMVDPSEISGGTVEELEMNESLGMVAESLEEYNKK